MKNNQIPEIVPITYQFSSTIHQQKFAHHSPTLVVGETLTALIAKNNAKDSVELLKDKMCVICSKIKVHAEVTSSNITTTKMLDVVVSLPTEVVEEMVTDSALMKIVKTFV